MTGQTTVTPSELYTRIASAFVADPSIEQELLADFEATVAQRFGVALPKRGALTRTSEGFRLTYDGKHYDIGDPRTAAKGELNDAELELVAGGSDDCPPMPTPGTVYEKKQRQPIQPNPT